MFGIGFVAQDHYHQINSRLSQIGDSELETKQQQVASFFPKHGVTFTVHGETEGTERMFPFDLIPRIIPSDEWHEIEQVLVQAGITGMSLL